MQQRNVIESGVMRQEAIEIRMFLNRDDVIKRHLEDAQALSGHRIYPGQGDDVGLTYRFSCEYFGQCAERLAIVNRLLDDPDIIRSASVQEFSHGRSLIMDVAAKLDRIITKLGGDVTPCVSPAKPSSVTSPPQRKRWWGWLGI